MNITCQDLATVARLLAAAYKEIDQLTQALEQSQAWNRATGENLASTQRDLGVALEKSSNGTRSGQPVGTT